MDDGARGQSAGRGHDGLTQRNGRLPYGRELDLVAAGALDRPTDARRHPQRQVGGIHDGVHLEIADVAVPELDPSQLDPRHPRSVRRPKGPGAAWYTRGTRRAIEVTTSHAFVVRSRATSATVIVSSPWRPIRTKASSSSTGDPGTSVTSTMIASIATRPTIGTRRAADQGLRPVREGPRPAVAVAEREGRDPARALRRERRAIADAPAGRQVRDADRAGHGGS